MLLKGIRKYFTNPILGILPFVLYIILQTYVLSVESALIISIGVTVVSQLFLRRYFNNKILGVTFYVTAIALIVALILWLLGNHWIEKRYTYILVGEIAIVVQLMFLQVGKTFLKVRLFKQKTFLEKALLNDYFLIATVLQYTLTTHVLLILTYKQITEGHLNETVDHIIYVIFPIIIIIGLCIYQNIRIKNVLGKLKKEEWLPIVTENGEVTGRIAKAVSKNMGSKFMHPVVRIALICNKKVYLQERDEKYILDAGKIDYPFEKYMLFKHEVNQAAHNSIKRMFGRDMKREPEFVFKYVFENEVTKRLVFLFTIKVDDEEKVTRTQKMTGKFWTVKQIDEEFGDGIFSECFELEYEYIKHMILLEDGDCLLAKDALLDNKTSQS